MFDLKNYHRADSVEEAVALLASDSKRCLIAGGTDILVKLREGKKEYGELVDIHGLEELRYIRLESSTDLLIGSGTTFTDIVESELLAARLPILVDAAGSIGGPQIRNVATIGGNICNGVTSGDSAMPLFCLDGKLVIQGVDGIREVAMGDFYLGPGKVDLRQGDVLVAFKIACSDYRDYTGCYLKYAMREAMDIATIGCAVSLKVQKKIILDYRIAYGVAAPVPIRCPQTEMAVAGQEMSGKLVRLIRQKVVEDVRPRTSWRATKEFRMHIIEELALRATEKALERAAKRSVDGR